jgi:hypothetical protein
MNKVKTIMIKDIMTNNPTLCLMPIRYFNRCYECPQFIDAEKKNRLNKLKCTYSVGPEYAEMQKSKQKIRNLKRQIKDIEEYQNNLK